MTQIARILLVFFLCQFTFQLSSIGGIVFAASMLGGTKGTSVIVIFQALGAVAALLFSRIPSSRASRNLSLIVASVLVSIAITVLPHWTIAWKLGILLRSGLGVLASARLQAMIPVLAKNEFLAVNRKAQTLSALAALLGFSMGPLINGQFGYRGTFLLDAILMVVATSTFIGYDVATEKAPGKGVRDILTSLMSRDVVTIVLITMGAWLIGGVFHVIEIPLLLERFNASPSMVSAVFAIALCSNLVFVRAFRLSWLEQSINRSLVLSVIGLLAACCTYLYVHQFWLATICVAAIGATNGMFNISQSSFIQAIGSEAKRVDAFILVRMFGQVAMLLSVLLVGKSSYTEIGVRMLVCAVVISIVSFLLLRSLGARRVMIASLALVFVITNGLANDKGKSELRIPVLSLPKNLDPANIFDVGSAMVLGQIFENLYFYDGNNNLQPGLASRHVWSQDLKKITIYIDTTRRFSDGAPLRAADVVGSIVNTISIMKEESSWAMGQIQGFDEFIRDPVGKRSVLKIEAAADDRIEVHFSAPFALFPMVLTSPNYSIYRKDSNNRSVGTGSYSAEKMSSDHWRLSRNHAEDGKYQFIRFIKVESHSEMLSLAKEKKVDLFEIGQKPDLLPIGYRIVEYPYLQAIILILNTQSPQFRDEIDRCGFLSEFHRVVKPSSYDWKPIRIGLPFSWEISKVQASANLRRKRKSGKRVEVLYIESVASFNEDIRKRLAMAMADSSHPIVFKRLPVDVLRKKIRSHDFSAIMMGYIPDYIHPDSILSPLLGTSQQYNFSGFSDRILDRNLKMARETLEKQKQNEIYRDVFRIMAKACPVSFLGTQDGRLIVGDNVMIPNVSQLGFHTLKINNISLAKD